MMRKLFAMGLAMLAALMVSSVCYAEEVGPHKGPVAVWGDEEYHLEVVADAKTGEVTVYVYGGHDDLHKAKAKAIDKKTAIALTLKTTDPATKVTLEAKPAKGDAEGKSSVFVGKNDAFKTDKKLTGTISAKLGTKPYTGDFKQK